MMIRIRAALGAFIVIGTIACGGGVPSGSKIATTPSTVVVSSGQLTPLVTPPPPTPRPFNPASPPTFTPLGGAHVARVCGADQVLRDPPNPHCQVKGIVAPDGRRYF